MLYAEHVKEPGEVLRSFVLYPCTIPVTTNRLLGASLRWATAMNKQKQTVSLSQPKCFGPGLVRLTLVDTFPKRQILDSSKLKEFADNKFEFDENGKKIFKWVENTLRKRRNCSLRAISPFPTVFSKDLYCRHVKTRACLGKG